MLSRAVPKCLLLNSGVTGLKASILRRVREGDGGRKGEGRKRLRRRG
jgi:hypothetical protein